MVTILSALHKGETNSNPCWNQYQSGHLIPIKNVSISDCK